MARTKSRPDRWADACADARNALSDLNDARERLDTAFSELRDLQSEYQDWLDNLAEPSRGTTTEEYLEAVTQLELEPDLEVDMGEAESALDEAEAADLPRGFGRD